LKEKDVKILLGLLKGDADYNPAKALLAQKFHQPFKNSGAIWQRARFFFHDFGQK